MGSPTGRSRRRGPWSARVRSNSGSKTRASAPASSTRRTPVPVAGGEMTTIAGSGASRRRRRSAAISRGLSTSQTRTTIVVVSSSSAATSAGSSTQSRIGNVLLCQSLCDTSMRSRRQSAQTTTANRSAGSIDPPNRRSVPAFMWIERMSSPSSSAPRPAVWALFSGLGRLFSITFSFQIVVDPSRAMKATLIRTLSSCSSRRSLLPIPVSLIGTLTSPAPATLMLAGLMPLWRSRSSPVRCAERASLF